MLQARSEGITFHPALVYKPNRVETRLLAALENAAAREKKVTGNDTKQR